MYLLKLFRPLEFTTRTKLNAELFLVLPVCNEQSPELFVANKVHMLRSAEVLQKLRFEQKSLSFLDCFNFSAVSFSLFLPPPTLTSAPLSALHSYFSGVHLSLSRSLLLLISG